MKNTKSDTKRSICIIEETWPLKKPFIISRSVRRETNTIKVTIREGDYVGSGEAVPTARYGETSSSVLAEIELVRHSLTSGLTRQELQGVMSPGAARNAVDLALWDLEAKLSHQNVSALSELDWPDKLTSVQTVSILSPEEMGREAANLKAYPVLKVKLNAESILERVSAVHESAPQTRLLIDANESWSIEVLESVAPYLTQLGVAMIEQPLAVDSDNALADYQCPLPLYADESCHTRADLMNLVGKYDGINIKLDKTGGLTEAILLMKAARFMGFEIMTGCMLSTSLGIAPAMFIATESKYIDLDAPVLLADDREHGLSIVDGRISPLSSLLWGA